jgi:hypothetical protein
MTVHCTAMQWMSTVHLRRGSNEPPSHCSGDTTLLHIVYRRSPQWEPMSNPRNDMSNPRNDKVPVPNPSHSYLMATHGPTWH